MKPHPLAGLLLVMLAGCSGVNVPAQVFPAHANTVPVALSVAVNAQFSAPVTAVTVSAAPVADATSTVETSGACSGTSCNITARMPYRYSRVVVTLFGNGSQQLASGSFRLTPGALGSVPSFAVAFGGDPVAVKLSVDPPDIVVGTSSNSTQLTLVARDAQGRRLIGQVPFTTSVSFTIIDPNGVTQTLAATFRDPNSFVDVHYNGSQLGRARFVPNVPNGTPAILSLVSPPSTTDGETSGDAQHSSIEQLDGIPTAPPNPPPLKGFVRRTLAASSVDLSPNFAPIGSQGSQLSCTAWASEYGIRTYMQQVATNWGLTGSGPFGINPDHVFSPAFLYNYLNNKENIQVKGTNGGLKAADVVAFVASNGAVSWTEMPWSGSDLSLPTDMQLQDGLTYRIGSVVRIVDGDMATVKNYLSLGYPIYWQISHGPSLHNLPSDHIYRSDTLFNDGHGMVIVGYDDSRGVFKFRNSWGTTFGEQGYGYITYDFWADSNDLGPEMYAFLQ